MSGNSGVRFAQWRIKVYGLSIESPITKFELFTTIRQRGTHTSAATWISRSLTFRAPTPAYLISDVEAAGPQWHSEMPATALSGLIWPSVSKPGKPTRGVLMFVQTRPP